MSNTTNVNVTLNVKRKAQYRAPAPVIKASNQIQQSNVASITEKKVSSVSKSSAVTQKEVAKSSHANIAYGSADPPKPAGVVSSFASSKFGAVAHDETFAKRHFEGGEVLRRHEAVFHAAERASRGLPPEEEEDDSMQHIIICLCIACCLVFAIIAFLFLAFYLGWIGGAVKTVKSGTKVVTTSLVPNGQWITGSTLRVWKG